LTAEQKIFGNAKAEHQVEMWTLLAGERPLQMPKSKTVFLCQGFEIHFSFQGPSFAVLRRMFRSLKPPSADWLKPNTTGTAPLIESLSISIAFSLLKRLPHLAPDVR